MANIINNRHEHGGIVIDGQQVGTTMQCPHCGGHFQSIPGSGKRRTFCMRCEAVTCGNPACDPCIPVEARLENAEGTKTRYDDLIEEMTKQKGVILL